MKQILAITRKELEGYFGSLLAIIFLGSFLAVVLFTFFTVETFFARNLADVRPLFTWMPILLIFLLAALTMRQWSEEQRSGTLEVLLTLPVSPFQLVIGKFLAVMVMIVVALLLTLPLPLTAANLGNLDWGPVAGGYLAALLMASTYAAIGLFVSSRTDNQIVSLIVTVIVGGLLYLVGTRGVTDFAGGSVGELLRSIGTGSRFESIERGVIDLRDLIYYLSLTSLFLLFNTISVESMRWSRHQTAFRTNRLTTAGLIGLNLLLVNVWLYPLYGLRMDLTAQKEYTISQTTKDLLSNLQEPLLLRGFLSENTHPLLAPLIPYIRDMFQEYEVAGQGKVVAQVVDPLKDPQIEAEANQTYGIKPSPFQVSGRHEASVINSYFDILVRYGDQSVVLNFEDLIEVGQSSTGIEVRLRNLEYDLTRAIKKVVYGFQSIDSVLAALNKPVNLTFYVTTDLLPSDLATAVDTIRAVAGEIQQKSKGKFTYKMVDPDAADSPVSRQKLIDEYGLQPFPTALFSTESYFFHMIFESEGKNQVVYPPADLNETEVRKVIENSIKQIAPGFLKTIGLWTPPNTPTQDMFGQMQQPISSYQYINQQISQEYQIEEVDLSTGAAPAGLDALVIVAPQDLTDKELFAIDQYLMRGGSLIIAASDYKLDYDQMQNFFMLTPIQGGLKDMLKSYGVDLSDSLVLDTQNEPLPIATQRDVGGFQVQEIQAMNYPFFVDVRSSGMNTDSAIVSGIQAITVNWASPVELDETKNSERDAKVILKSSPNSWLQDDIDILPDPETGSFTPAANPESYPLAVSIQGAFESYFKDKAKPQIGETEEPTPTPMSNTGPSVAEESNVAAIDRSPATARLVVVGSNTFIDDIVIQVSSQLSQDRYLNNLSFLQNAIDWSVEDLDLLSIRSRGTFTRVLKSMDDQEQTTWEVGNYIVAFLLLVGIYAFWQIRKRNQVPLELVRPQKPRTTGKGKGA